MGRPDGVPSVAPCCPNQTEPWLATNDQRAESQPMRWTLWFNFEWLLLWWSASSSVSALRAQSTLRRLNRRNSYATRVNRFQLTNKWLLYWNRRALCLPFDTSAQTATAICRSHFSHSTLCGGPQWALRWCGRAIHLKASHRSAVHSTDCGHYAKNANLMHLARDEREMMWSVERVKKAFPSFQIWLTKESEIARQLKNHTDYTHCDGEQKKCERCLHSFGMRSPYVITEKSPQ